ncbi:MAG: hypothetical protein NTY01_02390, partial [Verrucomicrobia bacterium]|nr:hypothetical protein [Verrucomicrobiota bacterium]
MNRRNFIMTTTGALAASALPNVPHHIPAASAGDKGAKPPQIPKPAPRFGDGRDWWFEKRFGLFV